MKLLQDLPSVSLADRAYLPPAAGVYIAATSDQLLYVGQSGNMRDRWVQHHKLDRLMGFPGVRLYYLLAPAGFCGQLESALIRQFAPLLNGNNGEVPLGDRSPLPKPLPAPKVVYVANPLADKVLEHYKKRVDDLEEEREMLRRRVHSVHPSVQRIRERRELSAQSDEEWNRLMADLKKAIDTLPRP